MPVAPAFCVTVHKCQGMTLPSITINCDSIFAPGQLAVALGRVKCLENITLHNFLPSHILDQPPHVMTFLNEPSKSFTPNCCTIPVPEVTQVEIELSDIANEGKCNDDDVIDDVDDTEFVVVEEDNLFIEQVLSDFIDKESESSSFVSDLLCPGKTDHQKTINNLVEQLQPGNVTNFSAKYNRLLEELFVQHCLQECNTKNMTAFQTAAFQLWTHDNFTDDVKQLFGTAQIGNVHIHIAGKLFLNIKSKFLQAKQHNQVQLPSSEQNISHSSQKKMYYLAGRCLHKCRLHFQRILKNAHPIKSPHHLQKHRYAEVMITHLSSLDTDHHTALEHHGHLIELTNERAIIPCALTYPTEQLFNFTMSLEQHRLPYHSLNALKLYGSSTFSICQESSLSNSSLQEKWNGMFTTSDRTHIYTLYTMYVTKYLNILHNQFRKEIRDKFNYAKKLACRATNKGHSDKSVLTYEFIISSQDSIFCHNELKKEITHAPTTFLKKFKVSELIHIAKGYNLFFNTKHKKHQIISELTQTVISSSNMPNPSFTESSKGKGKRKGNQKGSSNKRVRTDKSDDLYICPVCQLPYSDDINSIGCDKCNCWFHQNCAEMSDAEFLAASQSEDPWFCKSCGHVSETLQDVEVGTVRGALHEGIFSILLTNIQLLSIAEGNSRFHANIQCTRNL